MPLPRRATDGRPPLPPEGYPVAKDTAQPGLVTAPNAGVPVTKRAVASDEEVSSGVKTGERATTPTYKGRIA